MLTASNSPQTPLIEAGLHEAICYAIVDTGTAHSTMYNTDQRKIVLIWEIPDSRIDIPDKGNFPRAISKKYTMSLGSKANLRKDLVSWRTRDFTPEEEQSFELQRLLGVSCMLNIVHNRKASDNSLYAAISSVLPLKGKKLKAENPLVIYGIEEHGTDIPATLPPWLIEEIKKSPEYNLILHPENGNIQAPVHDELEPGVENEDDIPF